MLNTGEDFNYFYCLDWWPPNTASTCTPKSLCPLGSPILGWVGGLEKVGHVQGSQEELNTK